VISALANNYLAIGLIDYVSRETVSIPMPEKYLIKLTVKAIREIRSMDCIAGNRPLRA
jgi:hypothetical protein